MDIDLELPIRLMAATADRPVRITPLSDRVVHVSSDNGGHCNIVQDGLAVNVLTRRATTRHRTVEKALRHVRSVIRHG